MQIEQSKADTVQSNSGVRCTVCDHPQRTAIDSLVAHGTASERIVATQFGLTQAAVHRHKVNHIPKTLQKAVERAEIKESDEFLDHIRSMMAAGARGVQIGQKARNSPCSSGFFRAPQTVHS